jgi:hypothetical protein
MAEVTEEVKEATNASVRRAVESKKREEAGETFTFGKPMTRAGASDPTLTASDEDILNLDASQFGPAAFAAVVEADGVTGFIDSQIFSIDEERATKLFFTAPGQSLPKKPIYMVKAFHKDGRLVQLPFEEQIQNTAGGDRMDALGLRRYQNAGMTILIDWNTLIPVYCAAFDCWAKATPSGFCCPEHRGSTLPGADSPALQGVTTSRVWNG